MERKSLHAIQTIAKVGKVLSAIAYVSCLVGGICCVVAPVAAIAVAEAWRAMIGGHFANIAELHVDMSASFMLGIAFIVASLICRHGAEISRQQPTSFAPPETTHPDPVVSLETTTP